MDWFIAFGLTGVLLVSIFATFVILLNHIDRIFYMLENKHIRHLQEVEQLKTDAAVRVEQVHEQYTQELMVLKTAHQQELNDLRKSLERKMVQSRAVIRGQVAEQLFPLSVESPYKHEDMKFLGQPLDYIVFENYGEGKISNVVFLEFKTGNSGLSAVQRSLKEAVEAGNVEWRTVHHD
jgi:predicted Holliday junction resolvase-like endonuclease